MNEVVEFNKKSRVRSQASVWLVRLQEGLDQSQQRELEAWLKLDSMHEAQLLELAAIWDELEVLTELAPLFDGVSNHTDQAVMARGEGIDAKASWHRLGIAAGCAVVCGIGILLFTNERTVLESNDLLSNRSSQSLPDLVVKPSLNPLAVRHYRTPLGKQLEVRLSDGTKATLNTDTHIEVGFTEQQRTIRLVKGEAHFSVFKDSTRPLVVMVAGKSVKAVGTAFSVRKNASTEIEVAVDEGRVAVYQHSPSVKRSDQMPVAKLRASLDAGEVLTIAGDEQRLTQYDLDEMVDRLAWREGMIVINDETLDYVIQEFGRYSERKVLLADRKMGDIRVAGYFRLGDVDALMVALENNFNIRSEYYQDNKTYVLSQF